MPAAMRCWVTTGTAVVLLADNGAGSDRVAELGELVRETILPWGATIDAASEPGQGSSFELRLLTAPT